MSSFRVVQDLLFTCSSGDITVISAEAQHGTVWSLALPA